MIGKLQKGVDVFTNLAVTQARRVSGQLKAKILNNLRNSGTVGEYNAFVQQELLAPLRVAMVLAHVTTYKNYRTRLLKAIKQHKKRVLSLADFEIDDEETGHLDDVLLPYRKSLDFNIGKLESKYNTNALKVLGSAADNIEKELRKELLLLLDSGTNLTDAVPKLGKRFDELGLGPQKDYQLEAIFRTQMQIAFAAGKWQAEQDPDIASILWGYQYVTVGDDRVRAEHAEFEGVILPKDDAFWARFSPPNGWNCRCTAIPIFAPEEIKRPSQEAITANTTKVDSDFQVNFGTIFADGLPSISTAL